MAFCRVCGAERQPQRNFCSACGTAFPPIEVKHAPTPAPEASQAPNSVQRSGSRRLFAYSLVMLAVLLAAVAGWWILAQRDEGSPLTSSETATPSPQLTLERIEPSPEVAVGGRDGSDQPMPTATVTVTATASAVPTQLANVGPVAVRATALTACPNNLTSMGGGTGPERLVDGDTETGWRCDDRRDYTEGNVNTTPTVGQVIEFQFDDAVMVSGIEVVEGAAKDAFRWCENGRLRQVQWDFGDGLSPLITDFPDRPFLPSAPDLYYRIPVAPERETSRVLMTVLSIFPAGNNCVQGADRARPWEYGPTARPSEVVFLAKRG